MTRSDRPSPEAILAQEDFVRALARSLLADPGRADDVAQDTVVAALTRPPSSAARLRGWMAAVATNRARETVRGEQRRRVREHDAARPEGSVPSPDEIAEREAARRRVVDAVLALEQQHRDVLVLRYWEGLSTRELGRRLGVPTETARTRLKRAHARLRSELATREGRDWRRAIAPLAGTGLGAGALLIATPLKLAAAALLTVGAGVGIARATRPPAGPPAGAEVTTADLVEAAAQDPDLDEGGPPAEVGDRASAAAPTSAVEETEVTVRVVDEGGAPVADVYILLAVVEDGPPEILDSVESAEPPLVPAEPALAAMGYADESDDERRGGQTDAEGRLVLEFDEPTTWAVDHARSPDPWGSVRGWIGQRVATGGRLELVLRRMASATLVVTVLDAETGTPLTGHEVAAQRSRDDHLVVASAEHGTVELAVPVYRPFEGETKAPTLYGLHVLDERVGPIERELWLMPGERREVILRHDWMRTVSGVVVDSAGRPVAGATVVAGNERVLRSGICYLPWSPDPAGAVQADGDGRFVLATAEREVSAWHPDHGGATVEADADVTLTLPAHGQVAGRVTDAAGRAQAGFHVGLDHRRWIETDADGRYRFQGVEPGVHKLHFQNWQLKIEVEPGAELAYDFDGRLNAASIGFDPPLDDEFAHVFGEDALCSIVSRPIREGVIATEHLLPGSYWILAGDDLVRADLVGGAQTVARGASTLVVAAPVDTQLLLLPTGVSDHVQDLFDLTQWRRVRRDGSLTWRVAPGAYVLVREDGRREPVQVAGERTTVQLED